MAISISTDKTDENGKEILSYGTDDFPIAFFDDDLKKVKVPWHWHDEFELLIITKGEVKVHFRNHETTLKAKDGYFVNSSVLHSSKLISQDGFQHCMVFDPRIIAQKSSLIWNTYIAPIYQNNYIPFIRLSNDTFWQKQILDLIEITWQAGAYEDDDYMLTVTNSLSKIFSIIIKHINDQKIEDSSFSKTQINEQRVKKTLNYIHQNYKKQISIEEIASSANISVSTLLRLYKDTLQTTPIHYLIDYRLEKIAEQLLDNKSSIFELATDNGFNDASYFNRCFLKKYGTTPTKFINNTE